MDPTPISNKGPREVLIDVAGNTTLHGVPNAFRARSWLRKALWSGLFLTSLGVCAWQVIANINKYYSYPTSSSSRLVTGHTLEFPAVTFCNMNPVRKSEMNLSVLDALSLDASYMDNYEFFHDWYGRLDRDEIYRIGHSLETMLVHCNFGFEDCTDRKYFTYTFSGEFGNCYTFNGGNRSTRLNVSSAGPNYGVMLELNIEYEEYVPIITYASGIRLLIHNHTYMPMPETQGVTLAPGFVSNIAITRSEVRRAKPPYGECDDVDSARNELINAYSTEHDYVEYTTEACRFTCYQRLVIENCGCGDAWYPMKGKAFPSLEGHAVDPCLTPKDYNCSLQQLTLVDEPHNCPPVCPRMCLEIIYDQKISFGRFLHESSKYELNKTTGEVHCQEEDNFLLVMVYFERMDYNTYTTTGSYSMINLVSDQGGQVGLWLGLSILTLFEIVELLWDLTVSVILAKKKSAPEPSNPSETETSKT